MLYSPGDIDTKTPFFVILMGGEDPDGYHLLHSMVAYDGVHPARRIFPGRSTWGFYYMPRQPTLRVTPALPDTPRSYKDSISYKLFSVCLSTFDSFVVFSSDGYNYASKHFDDHELFQQGLTTTLNNYGKFAYYMYMYNIYSSIRFCAFHRKVSNTVK